MAMMQNGELDPAIAMQLLGQGMTAAAPKGDASDPQNGKKRPLDAVGQGESQEPDGDQEIDAFLKEAKRVRLDAQLSWSQNFIFALRAHQYTSQSKV